MRRSLVVAAVATVALTAACGSTVQPSQQVAAANGLGSQQQAADPSGTGATSGLGATTGATGAGPTAAGGLSGGTVATGGAATSAGPGVVGGTTTQGPAPRGREPLQIGFVTTSVGNAQSLGINAGNTYTDKAMFQALVAEYNAAGGVAGHKILPVYAETDTASSNWESDFAAACSHFTEDNHVKAVIGYVFVFLDSFEGCLAKAGVPHVSGGYQPGDVVGQQQFPTLVSAAHPTVDGYMLTALEGGWRSGLLTTSTKLGVIVDTCSHGDRAYQRTTEPWLKAHKINFQTITGKCSQGSGDASDAAAAISNAVLRFSSSGVDLVLSNPIEILLFMEAAQPQGYSPKYLTGTGGVGVEANAPASQMKNFHGFGWMPAVDVNARRQPYPQTPAQKACVAKLAKHGLQPAAYNDFMAAYLACDGLDLYGKALAATGSTAAASIVQGITSSLPAFQGASTYGGTVHAASRQRGGAATYREYGWTDACSCLTYRGRTFPLPNP